MASPTRHFKRYSVEEVRGRLHGARDLVVRDISLTGLSVETTVALQIGHVYALTMQGDNDDIEIPAEVKWCNLVHVRESDLGGMENVYHAGMDFSRALDERAQELFLFIEGHIVIELDRHLRGRFKNPAHTLDDFLVKSVSFHGMLIEARRFPPLRKDALVEIEVDDKRLRLKCAARAAAIEGHDEGEERCDIRLEFKDLSIDSGLALDHFIRTVLE